MYKKILVAVDGSKFAKNAVRHALSIAKSDNAELIALSVIDNTNYLGLSSKSSIFDVNDILTKESKKNLEEVKNIVGEEISLKTDIAEGSPANEIINYVEENDIDLIIMGSSGKTGLEKFLLGSVADKVVKGSKTSVLIVR